MYLGIQIGRSKLRLGVGSGDRPELLDLQCHEIDPSRGPAGVLEQIDRTAPALLQRHGVTRIGIGFPGEVDANLGRIVGSPSLEGWEQAELSQRHARVQRGARDLDEASRVTRWKLFSQID